MSRPVLLLGLLVTLSGCTGGIPPFLGDQTAPQLGSAEIRNDDTEPHTVDVLIERNETLVYWTTRRMPGRENGTIHGAVLIPGRYEDAPGTYVIYARLDNSTSGHRFALSEKTSSGCYVVQIRIEEDGTITFLTSKGAYECQQAGVQSIGRLSSRNRGHTV